MHIHNVLGTVVECGGMEWNGLEWSPSSKVTMIKSEDHDSGVWGRALFYQQNMANLKKL